MIKIKDLRHIWDITPWDDTGHSFWGLKRHQAKWVSQILIIIAILLMIPPQIPDPFDLVNIWLAAKLSVLLTISKISALIITYTILPWGLFLLGIWIAPFSTQSLFNGYLNKLKRVIMKYTKKPFVLVGLGIIGYFMIQWYATYI